MELKEPIKKQRKDGKEKDDQIEGAYREKRKAKRERENETEGTSKETK